MGRGTARRGKAPPVPPYRDNTEAGILMGLARGGCSRHQEREGREGGRMLQPGYQHHSAGPDDAVDEGCSWRGSSPRLVLRLLSLQSEGISRALPLHQHPGNWVTDTIQVNPWRNKGSASSPGRGEGVGMKGRGWDGEREWGKVSDGIGGAAGWEGLAKVGSTG